METFLFTITSNMADEPIFSDDGTHDAPEEQKPNKFLVRGAVLLKQILEERVCESTKKKVQRFKVILYLSGVICGQNSGLC